MWVETLCRDILCKTEFGANTIRSTPDKKKTVDAFNHGNDLAHLGPLEQTKTREDIYGANNRWWSGLDIHAVDIAPHWKMLQSNSAFPKMIAFERKPKSAFGLLLCSVVPLVGWQQTADQQKIRQLASRLKVHPL